MPLQTKAYVIIVFIVAGSVLADWLLKIASQRASPFATAQFWAGAALYALTAAGWLLAMRQMNLASIAVAYSILTILLLAALGALIFREVLSTRELLGIVFACFALALMSERA